MNAQEMFEAQGYKKVDYDVNNLPFIVLYKDNRDSKHTIGFFENKESRHQFKGCNVGSVSAGFSISVELLKVIQQQLEELGWLDE